MIFQIGILKFLLLVRRANRRHAEFSFSVCRILFCSKWFSCRRSIVFLRALSATIPQFHNGLSLVINAALCIFPSLLSSMMRCFCNTSFSAHIKASLLVISFSTNKALLHPVRGTHVVFPQPFFNLHLALCFQKLINDELDYEHCGYTQWCILP